MTEDQQRSRDLPSLVRQKYKLKTGDQLYRNSTNTTRSMSAFLPNHENVEKIAAVVQQLKKDSKDGHLKSSHGISATTAQRIMDGFKQKIRSNFNTLYHNYEGNRDAISSEIRMLEKNKTVHTQMSNKFEQTLKQKNHYDKIKAQVRQSQHKLDKLKEVLQKEQGQRMESNGLKQQLDQRLQQLAQSQEIREQLDYQKAVLLNMREIRRNLRNVAKNRFIDDWKKWSDTNRLINKFWNENQAKKLMMVNLASKMPSQPTMPEKLAMELETKLEEYYGKQAYMNIFSHENILNEEANRMEQLRLQQQRQNERRIKQSEDRKEKKHYEDIDVRVMNFKEEEQRMRKICGVNDINQISENLLVQDGMSLEQLKQQYDNRLNNIIDDNNELQREIQQVLSKDINMEDNLRSLKKQYTLQHQQERKLFNQAQKCNSFLEDLMFIVERVTEEPGTKKDMNMMLAAFSSKIERLVLVEKLDKPKLLQKQKTPMAKIEVEKGDWQEASHGEEQFEYLNNQFSRNKVPQKDIN